MRAAATYASQVTLLGLGFVCLKLIWPEQKPRRWMMEIKVGPKGQGNMGSEMGRLRHEISGQGRSAAASWLRDGGQGQPGTKQLRVSLVPVAAWYLYNSHTHALTRKFCWVLFWVCCIWEVLFQASLFPGQLRMVGAYLVGLIFSASLAYRALLAGGGLRQLCAVQTRGPIQREMPSMLLVEGS